MMRREWLVRALRTFVQTALGYAAANAAGVIGDGAGATKNALAALMIASVAAGLAALMNIGNAGAPAKLNPAETTIVEEAERGLHTDPEESEDADE